MEFSKISVQSKLLNIRRFMPAVLVNCDGSPIFMLNNQYSQNMSEKSKIGRRAFLGTGLTAAASVAVGNSLHGVPAKGDLNLQKLKSEHPYNERTHLPGAKADF